MDQRKLFFLAAALSALAGCIAIFNAIAENPEGASFPLGNVARGVFYLAVALGIYAAAVRKR